MILRASEEVCQILAGECPIKRYAAFIVAAHAGIMLVATSEGRLGVAVADQ